MILARAQENAGGLETVHVASGRDYFLLPTISSEMQGSSKSRVGHQGGGGMALGLTPLDWVEPGSSVAQDKLRSGPIAPASSLPK